MAITRVQSAIVTTGSVNIASLSLTFNAAPSIADGKNHYILVAVGGTTTGSAINTTADYSWWEFQHTNTINNAVPAIFLGRVFGSPASSTITITSSAANAFSAVAVEYKSDNPLRIDKQQLAAASSTSPSSGATAATASAAELCFAALAHRCQAAGTSQTSGTLVVGHSYKITTFVAGDNFSNVGASSNAAGVCFVATGTTPTTWTNASTLFDLTGTFTAPSGSFTEIVAGGVTTNLNTANNDREIDALERITTVTGAQTAGATVAVTNNWGGVVITLEEFTGLPSQSNRISGS